jgi:SAM-dependent methyltransferase/rhodanese-related sulfurtransferase
MSVTGNDTPAHPRELSMAEVAAMWRAAALERELRAPAPSGPHRPLRDGAVGLWDTFDLHLLDVRPAEAFQAGHIPDAASIPAADLRARTHELPRDRGRLVVVAATADEARRAAGSLVQPAASRGSTVAAAAPTPAAAPASAAAPAALAAAVETWPGPWETGPPRRVLWEPSPAVRTWAARLPAGRALDLGCGAGRDTAYLAAAGHDVLAVDRLPDALDRAAALACRLGLTIRTLALDLRHERPTAVDGFDLVLMIRFLDRTLLPWAAEVLRPGGCFILETFAGPNDLPPGEASGDGSGDVPGDAQADGPRRDRWILAPQEALRTVTSWNASELPVRGARWTILEYLEYAEGSGAAHAAMTRLVARKQLVR